MLSRSAWCGALLALYVPLTHAMPTEAELEAYDVITNVEPISTGFVFYDHAYIDAPYRVTQRGVSVYINDIKVYSFPLYALFPSPTQAELAMATSPPPPNVHVVTRRGVETVEEAVGQARTWRRSFESSLMAGRMLVISKNTSALYSCGGDKAKRHLQAILTLRTKEPAQPGAPQMQTQGAALHDAGFRLHYECFPGLMTNFTASPQLEQRIQEMLSKEQEPEE